MKSRFDGNHKEAYALVTGASSGIGEEFCRQLAEMGYPLILSGRNTGKLESLSEELPVKCEIFPCDLRDDVQTRRLCALIGKTDLSLVVNCAGLGLSGPFDEADPEKDVDVIDVDVRAFHRITKAAVRRLEEQGYGGLLNVASSAGLFPAGPYMGSYYAAKAYAASITRAVAYELKEKDSPVYVGCLCPGPVNTAFNEAAGVHSPLGGISARQCVSYALRCMKSGKVMIVPELRMRAGITFGRFLPQPLLIRMVAAQQKKKMRIRKQ